MKKAIVRIERTNVGGFSAYLETELPYGIHGVGNTSKEAVNDFYMAYEDMRESYKEDKQVFEEFDFIFKYDVASFLQYYAFAFSLAGLERIHH